MNDRLFMIVAAATTALTSAVRALGGQPMSPNSWLARWSGTADELCHHLRPTSPGRIIVCALTGDWSYR